MSASVTVYLVCFWKLFLLELLFSVTPSLYVSLTVRNTLPVNIRSQVFKKKHKSF